MSRTVTSVAVLLASPLATLVGQWHGVAPGDHVRITLRHDAHTVRWPGNVMRIDGDTLLLEPTGGGPPIAIPEPVIQQIEISRGLQSGAHRGALVGLAVGGSIGALLGAGLGTSCIGMGDTVTCPLSVGLVARVALDFGAVFGAIGAGLGALTGSTTHSERWERAWLPRARVAAGPGGLGVTLSLAF